MPKVLIIVDKFGWSYDSIARGIVRHNSNPTLSFDIVSLQDDPDFIERNHSGYDLVFAMGWTLIIAKKKKHNYREMLPFLERKKLITGIHSHRSWDEYSSLPDTSPAPSIGLVDKLAQIKNINVISRRLYKIFSDAGLENLSLTENGVDAELFKPVCPINTNKNIPLVLGFSGSTNSPKHDYLKGLSEFILPLRDIPNVEVKVLGGRGEQQVSRVEMPELYNQIDLYICASTSEGFSQSVLEASSCGRGVVSTKVGGCEDLIDENENGVFIKRDLAEIRERIIQLEADRMLVKRLGENSRRKILEQYSWAIRVKDWLKFVEANLPATEQGQCASSLIGQQESIGAAQFK